MPLCFRRSSQSGRSALGVSTSGLNTSSRCAVGPGRGSKRCRLPAALQIFTVMAARIAVIRWRNNSGALFQALAAMWRNVSKNGLAVSWPDLLVVGCKYWHSYLFTRVQPLQPAGLQEPTLASTAWKSSWMYWKTFWGNGLPTPRTQEPPPDSLEQVWKPTLPATFPGWGDCGVGAGHWVWMQPHVQCPEHSDVGLQ